MVALLELLEGLGDETMSAREVNVVHPLAMLEEERGQRRWPFWTRRKIVSTISKMQQLEHQEVINSMADLAFLQAK